MRLKKNLLIYLTFSLSIIGIIVIYLLSNEILPRKVKISEISYLDVGSYVSVTGIVKKVNKNKVNKILICDESCIEARFFFDFYLSENDYIQLSGVVKEYEKIYIEVKKKEDIKIIK